MTYYTCFKLCLFVLSGHIAALRLSSDWGHSETELLKTVAHRQIRVEVYDDRCALPESEHKYDWAKYSRVWKQMVRW